ncbi:MAG: sporulation protein [Lachnospiraceae bacterium]|nr:sporulation protein [Lachnospiraceae bacterium]
MNSNSCGDLNQFLQEYLAKNYPNLACYFNLTCPNQNTCANPTDHSCIPEVTPTIPEESASAPDEVITIPEESPTNSDEATENHDAPAGNPDDTGLPTYEEQVVALVNAERAKEGLPALKVDETLQAAALARAKETVQLFSHTRPNGTSCFTILKEYGISYRYAGENIAYGQRSPEEVVNAWMNSEGHRANIMNKNFTTIGIGYYQTANGTKYWSQLFLS